MLLIGIVVVEELSRVQGVGPLIRSFESTRFGGRGVWKSFDLGYAGAGTVGTEGGYMELGLLILGMIGLMW